MSFAFMIDQIFADPVIAKDALYTPKDTVTGYPIRVTLDQPDEVTSFGEAQLHATTTLISVRESEVAEPKAGDSITIGTRTFVVMGEPRADSERLVWKLVAYEA